MFNKKKKAIDQVNQNRIIELVKKNNKLINKLETKDLEIEFLKKQLFITETSLRGAEIEIICKDREIRKANLQVIRCEGKLND